FRMCCRLSLRISVGIAGLALLSGIARAEAASPLQTVSASPAVPASDKPLPDTTARYSIVFDAWAAKWQPESAILVVRRNGKTVFAKGQNADPQQPTMIASLSKPITGACVATLIRDRKIAFSTRLREGLSRFFGRYGKPADPRLGDV